MIVEYFQNIEFARPYLFWLFLLLPLLIIFYVAKNKKRTASLVVSTNKAPGMGSWKTSFLHFPFVLRLLTLSAIIISLAGPQTRNEQEKAEGEGIDIVLCIDVSGSMTAQDLTPNRLEAAKAVAIDFINRRKTDRIGIVIFSGESFTQCPLTTDKQVLVDAVKNIRNGLLEDGTAIGSGLSTSVDRLRNSTSKTKIVVLLTDGENNGGLIDPNTAKEIAISFGIRVYTIGVGTDGYAPQPIRTDAGIVMSQQKVSIDEALLTQIATETGGKYFRAKDNESLSNIYSTIDKLEKSKIEITKTVRFQDKFFPFVFAAIIFLFIEIIFRYVFFRRFP